MGLEPPGRSALDRRTFLHAATRGAAASGVAGSLAWPRRSAAFGGAEHSTDPAAKPIPGGLQSPDVPLIHVWAPGDPG